MNVLIFPEYGYPANHAVVNTVYEDLLPSRGHTVHMVRPMAGLSAPALIAAPWPRGVMAVFPDEPFGRPLANLSMWRRRRAWTSRALRELRATRYDMILVRNELTAAVAAGQEARRRGIPLVFQISSPDAESMVSLGRAQRGLKGLYKQIRGRAGLAMRRRVSRRAAAVLAISDAMRAHLVETEGLDAHRVFAFPMGAPGETGEGVEVIAALRRRLDLPEGKTIVYSGVIDPSRRSAWMLDVLELVRRRIDGVVLLVVSYQTDDRRRAFEELVRSRRLPVRFAGPVPFREVDTYLRSADVMISPVPPSPELRISSPTKTLEGLGAGLAVVGSAEVDEHRAVFDASGGGIAVPWDQERFAEAIVSLLGDPSRRLAMGHRGRQWVLAHRTYDHLTEYLERILQAAGSLSALGDLPHSP